MLKEKPDGCTKSSWIPPPQVDPYPDSMEAADVCRSDVCPSRWEELGSRRPMYSTDQTNECRSPTRDHAETRGTWWFQKTPDPPNPELTDNCGGELRRLHWALELSSSEWHIRTDESHLQIVWLGPEGGAVPHRTFGGGGLSVHKAGRKALADSSLKNRDRWLQAKAYCVFLCAWVRMSSCRRATHNFTKLTRLQMACSPCRCRHVMRLCARKNHSNYLNVYREISSECSNTTSST